MDGGSIFENDDSLKKIDSNFETLIEKYKKKDLNIQMQIPITT